MSRMVEIEFTEDTFGADGDVKREKGARMRVDPVSAHSFVDIKKVARRLDDAQPEPESKPAPAKRAKAKKPVAKSEPEPVPDEPEPEPESEPVEGDN